MGFLRSNSSFVFTSGKDWFAKDDKSEDYYRNVEYHREKPLITKYYLKFAALCYRIVNESSIYSAFILGAIIGSSILIGVDTYLNSPESTAVVTDLDILLVSIFCLECFLKVSMEGLAPWRYFTGPEYMWNWFDFIIIVLSLSISSGSITFLRLVRLARLGKFIHYVPALQLIVTGFLSGITSLLPIMLLLVMVFYVFGMIAYYLFSASDPFHFGDLSM